MRTYSLLLSLLLFLSADALEAQRRVPLVVDYKAVTAFESIPDSALLSSSRLRLMFRHASVGGTVDDGLDCLQGTRSSPSECTVFPDYRYDRRAWIFQPRGNSGWYGKLDDFEQEVRTQLNDFDVFSFKYCYLDGLDGLAEPCGSPFKEQTAERAWTTLRDAMERLESSYPGKLFVWWTIPLTQVGQYCTEFLNARIRAHTLSQDKILFDIADIQAHDENNNHVVNANGWEIAYKPFCGEQKPDAQACHPNWPGKIRLAKAFWWMMANIGATTVISSLSDMSPGGFEMTVYPNPARDRAVLRVTLTASSSVSVMLVDAVGRPVRTVLEDEWSGGTRTVSFNTGTLSAGLYFVRVISSHGSGHEAFHVLK